ncbi:MAG TPA: hypothetical protein GXX55_04490 [Firmicutes bacterium]|nr:hypothetical protein [Bacillota bacterium]
MEVRAVAPNRIDLAGGTLDLYPLYLFEDGGLTVNVAIDVNSTVTIRTREDREIHIYSLDTHTERHAADLAHLEVGGELDLVARVIRFYAPPMGIDVFTENQAPKGSGLGASSALLIALSHALNKLRVDRRSDEDIINIGANLEAQTIRVPTGKQDYYAATYGGVNAIWFDVEENRVERLIQSEAALEALSARMILSFTGAPRFSAITNWGMMRAYIENRGQTVERMKRIKQTAFAMRECISAGRFVDLAELLAEEWQNRRELAEGVTTPDVERLMEAAARAGARASKLCGAGGGGCMVTMLSTGGSGSSAGSGDGTAGGIGIPDELKAVRERVIEALENAGARVIPFSISRVGVQVEVRTESRAEAVPVG